MIIQNLNQLMDVLGVDKPSSFGRAVYRWVDCGPWLEYVTENSKFYYGDEETDKKVTNGNCVGIQVGSIVEGSDAEIGPVLLEFPFDLEKFWTVLDDINEEACYEWDIANNEDWEEDE